MFYIERKSFYKKIKLINNPVLFRMLEKSDPARLFSMISFYDSISKVSNNLFNRKIKTAVISGSKNECELTFFKNTTVDCLCFDASIKEGESQFWDLNRDWSDKKYSSYFEKYDLVLCEQVLEHIAFPEQAFRNIKLLMKKGGYAHFSVPSMNGVHVEPYYFTAGYHHRMLAYWAKKIGNFKIIDCNSWGTKKAAKMYSVCDWNPLPICGDLRDFVYISSIFKIKQFIKFLIHKLKYNFESIWKYSDKDFPVIAWLLLEKV